MPQLLLNPTSLSASSSGSARLNEALFLLERRLAAWSRDPVAFHALLQQVFGVPPRRSAESAALLTTISGSGLGISLQILDATTIDGLIAVYASAATDGDERIYLNASWLDLATPEQIEVVLLEELGHAIDGYLNDTNDISGDEGAIFSALLRGKTSDPGAYRENDHHILNIDGVAVAVEASTDTTRPTGSLGSFATTPAYVQEGGDTPFGIADVGNEASPTFADIDDDGDLDLFIGDNDGNTNFFRNAGSASAPVFTQIADVGNAASPTFADIDDDGDLDLFIGDNDGNTNFFRNTGSASAPVFTQEGGDNPFGITYVSLDSKPSFADIDSDGDLDLFIGDSYGRTSFFRNTGSLSAPVYTQEGGNTPFGIPEVGYSASPVLADIDADGDLDLFVGGSYGSTRFFRNTGSASAPAYSQEGGGNPFGITYVGTYPSPAFADADDDGDLDLFIGERYGKTLFFRNTGSASTPAYTREGGNTPFGIPDVGRNAFPSFADADADGDLDLFIGNYDGNTNFFLNTGSASAPAYTRQEGDIPFGITVNDQYPSFISRNSKFSFADIDSDGDLDFFIGTVYGLTYFFRNTGSASVPAYTQEGEDNPPFGITDVGSYASPALVDADDDGDLDLFIGNGLGRILFFRNTAAPGATTPAYTQEGGDTPLGIARIGLAASPTFADIDRDGDLDLFIGQATGSPFFYRNTGSASAPAFEETDANVPFGIAYVGNSSSPIFADIDDDGDLDLFIGNTDGNTRFFRNTAATPVAPVNATIANGSYGIGDVIKLTVGFSEAVFVDTTSGTPTLQLETGITDRFATYRSGSFRSTLTFKYTVQDGDSSTDLDQLSSTALTLNGGTINDAAGNTAILTLAAPGEIGSLAANADLVIDGVYPTVTSASIDGDTLTINFDEDIDSTIPKANNFKVMNGRKKIKVKDVSVDTDADTVVLSLKDAVEADDVITLDYKSKKKDQTQGVVQDLAGNDLQSFKGQAVINETFVDLTPPTVSDVFIGGDKLTINFDEDIDSTIPKANNFKVMNGSKKIRVEDVSVDTNADTVVLSLKDAVEADDVITLDYKTKKKDQTQDVVEDLAGNDLQSFKGQAVINETFVDPNIDLTPPTVSDVFIGGDKLTINFDEDIDSTIPKANNFKVMNGSKKIKIEGVSVDTAADTVVLSLKDAVEPDDVVTFDYKTKSKDQTQGVVQDLAGNDLQSFKGQAVSNITADIITDTSVNDAFSETTFINDRNHINSTFKMLDSSSDGSNLIDDIFGTSNPIL